MKASSASGLWPIVIRCGLVFPRSRLKKAHLSMNSKFEYRNPKLGDEEDPVFKTTLRSLGKNEFFSILPREVRLQG